MASPQEDDADFRAQFKLFQTAQQNTTLEELLEECHSFHERFKVETDPSKSTQGTHTNPERKKRPDTLRFWHDFRETQQIAYDSLDTVLHPKGQPAKRLFTSRNGLNSIRDHLQERPIASEDNVKEFRASAVETIIARMVHNICEDSQLMAHLHLKKTIIFNNHTNSLIDDTTGTREQPTKADRICHYSSDSTENSRILVVIEYKAAHKLTLRMLKLVLAPDSNIAQDIDIKQDVPTETDPQDDVERFEANARLYVTAALCQAWRYMIDAGLEFSCVETGEATVFLKIDEANPGTLYHYLSIPQQDVDPENVNILFFHAHTAVAQLFSFILMAVKSERRSQDWRDRAVEQAELWERTPEDFLRDLPKERTIKHKISPSYKGRISKETQRSPYITRHVRIEFAKLADIDTKQSKSHKDDIDSDDSDNDGGLKKFKGPPPSQDTPTHKIPSSRGRGGRGGRGGNAGRHRTANVSPDDNTDAPYCTQACLLGLMNNLPLDPLCPNTHLHHRNDTRRKTHLLNAHTFSRRVEAQLAISIDKGLTDTYKQGSRGRLLKLTLLSHGYTLVGKATCGDFIPHLLHEAVIYARLKPLQGEAIPVYLGNVDMARRWRDLGICLRHMMLLSFCGVDLLRGPRDGSGVEELKGVESVMKALGVVHGDLAERNALWCEEVGRLMVCDFGESILIDFANGEAGVSDGALVDEMSKGEAVAEKRVVLGEGAGNVLRKVTRGRKSKTAVRGPVEHLDDENVDRGGEKNATTAAAAESRSSQRRRRRYSAEAADSAVVHGVETLAQETA